MTDLIRRLEEAKEGSRELDAAIALATGYVTERDGTCFYGNRDFSVMVLERGYYDHAGNAPELPYFTFSLDAALALIPDGLWWKMDSLPRVAWVGRKKNGTPTNTGRGATMPLALCIAILRAMEAKNE